MINNTNFDQQLNAELNRRLGINASTVDSMLTPEELASVMPLLNLAEQLQSAPTPTLSSAAQARIEAQLHNHLIAPSAKPTRVQRLPRWQLLAASLVVIMGLGLMLSLFNGADDSIHTTQIAHATKDGDLSSGSETSAHNTPAPDIGFNGPTPDGLLIPVDDDLPAQTPTVTRDIEMASANDVVFCENSTAYWQSNPAAWTITELTIGGQTYTESELLAILETASDEDASLYLAQAFIIAHLNGSSASALADAADLLDGYTGKLPFAVDTADPIGRAMLNTAENLQPTIRDCVTVTPIDVNNAAPDTIGNGDGNGNPDPDNCKNPPPEHANAQGWRERCENGGSNGSSNNGNGNGKGNGSNSSNGNDNNK